MRAHDAATANATPFLTSHGPSWLASPALGSEPLLAQSGPPDCSVFSDSEDASRARARRFQKSETRRRSMELSQLRILARLTIGLVGDRVSCYDPSPSWAGRPRERELESGSRRPIARSALARQARRSAR